jgi:opacity protein-like surface antigen
MKFSKKRNMWLTSLLGIYSCYSFAGVTNPIPSPNLHHGFYIGASVGANALSGEVGQVAGATVFAGLPYPVTNITVTPNTSVNHQSAVGGILAGYDFLLAPRLLIGLEARINFLNGKVINQTNLAGTSAPDNGPLYLINSSSTEVKQDINLLLKPGVFLSESNAIYLVGGALTNKLKSSNYATYSQDLGPTILAENSNYFEKWQWGSIFGIGAQQDLFHGLALRLEYDHLNYKHAPSTTGNVALATIPADAGPNGNLTTSSRVSLKSDRVTLGLTYHFA